MWNPALQTATAINTMEIARNILGHVVGVTPDEVDAMFDVPRNGGSVSRARTGLIRYALLLAKRQQEFADERLPLPVIPCVDVANLRVSHATCTGRTGIGVAEGRASMTRSVPLDPDSPRDIALWLLLDANLASNRLFEHANVFGQDVSASPRELHGIRAEDGSTLDPLRALEGIAVLIEHGVTVEDACGMACKRGLCVDPETVLASLDSRRIGLWLHGRPWCQDAWRVLTGQDPACQRNGADLPVWAREARSAMRGATDSGRRSGASLLAATKPSHPLNEELPEWERELLED